MASPNRFCQLSGVESFCARFVQREIFLALLVSFLTHGLDMNIRLGFEQMNQALKLQAEQGRLLSKK
jgi:hypothetical protein